MKYLNNKTKIIATIGPATSSYENLKRLIESGVNVCRLNFSHGSHEDHKKVIDFVRQINGELDVHTGLLADLQGPKIRVGEIENGSIKINPGDEIYFTSTECIGNKEKIWVSYPGFAKDVKAGEMILLDDGKIKLEIVNTNGLDLVTAKVIHGEELKSKKGVNLPNTRISLPCLTDKDLKDLDFVLDNNIPWIGLSFVRKASDVKELKAKIKKQLPFDYPFLGNEPSV